MTMKIDVDSAPDFDDSPAREDEHNPVGSASLLAAHERGEEKRRGSLRKRLVLWAHKEKYYQREE